MAERVRPISEKEVGVQEWAVEGDAPAPQVETPRKARHVVLEAEIVEICDSHSNFGNLNANEGAAHKIATLLEADMGMLRLPAILLQRSASDSGAKVKAAAAAGTPKSAATRFVLDLIASLISQKKQRASTHSRTGSRSSKAMLHRVFPGTAYPVQHGRPV
ncbi:hypothetical protein V8D89_009471 [Ganoderma adspersum]